MVKKIDGCLMITPVSISFNDSFGNMCLTENCVICLNPAKYKRLNGGSKALAVQKIKNKAGIANMGERLKCGHIYHRKCILSWFLNLDSENSYNCPLCRGDIQFSNNMGMMNWMLFDRKYRLEYDKAYAEGYREDQDDYSEDDGDSADSGDYDGDSVDSGSVSSWENYDDFAEGMQQPVRDLRYYLSHEGDDELDSVAETTPRNLNCYRLNMSYRCNYKLCRSGIEHLTFPKSPNYAFRPHPCSFVH